MSSNVIDNKGYRQWIGKSYFEQSTPLLKIVPQVADYSHTISIHRQLVDEITDKILSITKIK